MFFLIEVPVFNFDLAISVGQNIEQLKDSLRKVWDEEVLPDDEIPTEIPSFAGGITLRKAVGPYAIPYAIAFPVHPAKQPDGEGHSAIPHEVFHVVASVLSSRGIPLTDETEEVYAYLTGFLNKQIYNRL